MNNNVSKKILSLALAVGMIATAIQAGSASAAGAIIAFIVQPEETANQTLAFGTEIEELTLPDSLISTEEVVADTCTIDWAQDLNDTDELEQAVESGNSLTKIVRKQAATISEVVMRIALLNSGAVTLQESTGTMTIGGTSGYNLADDRDGTGWSWIANTSTLTLNSTYTGQGIDIQCARGDTVYLEYSGDVTVNGKLWSDGSMEINCTGTDTEKLSVNNAQAAIAPLGDLVIRSGTVSATSGGNAAFNVGGSLSILGSATVEALGGFFHADLLCQGTLTIDTIGAVYLHHHASKYISAGTINYVNGTFQTGDTMAIAPSVSDVSDISMTAGENVTKTVNLGEGYFAATGYTVSSNDSGVAVVSLTDDTITIVGVNGGTTSITITWVGGALAGQSANINVEVTAPPTISITTHPATLTKLTEGSINDSLSIVAMISNNESPSYEWFSCDDTSYRNPATTNVTTATFTIPTTLTAETYYYYCEISATGATSVRSNIAMVTVTVTDSTTPTNTYMITFNANGGMVANASIQTGTDGKLVSLPTSTRSNYRFDGWFTASSGGTQISTSTVFTGNDTVYAHWTYTGGSDSNSGNSDNSSKSVVTVTPAAQPNQPTVGIVTGKVGGTATQQTFTVTDNMVKVALEKAQIEAKVQNRTAYGVGARIVLDTPITSGLTLTLERSALNRLVSAGTKHLELAGIPIALTLDAQALTEIQKQGTGNVTITVKPVEVTGIRIAYCTTLSSVKGSKTVSITNLGIGSVTFSIPCTPIKNEVTGYLYAVHVDSQGKLNRIADSSYDANSGSIIFSTNHFSVYGVGYTAHSAKFKDIEKHWAKESIDYVVGRKLLSGTSDTTFAPDTAITRGMLVTALGRLAGVDVKAYTTNSFTDVKDDSTICAYIEWACSKGIIQGIGNQQFAPDWAVTRQEIAVILQNYAKATGYKLPVTREVTTYADTFSIGSVYKMAVRDMQQAGIMMGEQNNRFNPNQNATRAEVSTMLHRYIKLTIDPATAQDWAMNDDGQYLYYKDGKAITGWWDIGVNGNNKTYYFDTYGNMVYGKWVQIEGKWYYFYANGSLAQSTKIDDFEIDENGVRKTN